MRLWDCFMFNDELDMLECRLRELEKMPVHRHVIVEAPADHRGNPKPLYYLDNRERFAPWADRITHIIARILPGQQDPWVREHAQRDAAMGVLGEAADDDVVLISDVDEFPPAQFPAPGPAVSFSQRLMMYAVDWEFPAPHICTVAARAGYIREHGLARVRDGRYDYPVADGGWHLTWLGGLEAQRKKLQIHCHLEMSDYEASLIADGRCYREGAHHSGQAQMVPVDVDASWPTWIYQRRCPENWFRPRHD